MLNDKIILKAKKKKLEMNLGDLQDIRVGKLTHNVLNNVYANKIKSDDRFVSLLSSNVTFDLLVENKTTRNELIHSLAFNKSQLLSKNTQSENITIVKEDNWLSALESDDKGFRITFQLRPKVMCLICDYFWKCYLLFFVFASLKIEYL